jgi:Tfp pilus assembly protein PilX
MSFIFHLQKRRRCRSGIALIITLALLAVVVLLLITFVSLAQLDSTATTSYSGSVSADSLAHASLNLVVSQLQTEMGKDSPADTGGGAYSDSPVYTNVTSANILPQGVGTNIDLPIMVKMSTNAPFFTDGPQATSPLAATGVSTTTLSQNGRSVTQQRWQQSYFGNFASAAQAPYWVITTRSGATNAAGLGFGTSGNTLNNVSSSNPNYAIGRFAYAIYNEGGLLDVTAAGTPPGLGLTASQQDMIKGDLAGADLAQLSGLTPSALTQWRNTSGGSGASASTFTNAVTIYAATNAAGYVFPGDTTFLSRQDLIGAAIAGQAGLTTDAVTNLTTFTREQNRPSWAPSLNAPAGGAFSYANNATTPTATNLNPLIPLIRVANANAAHVGYHDLPDAGGILTYADPIAAGDPVARRRFSLARLAWLGSNGPANGATKTAIQDCFGLIYAPSLDGTNYSGVSVWQYVGPTGTTEQTSIETLAQVAAEPTPREPNFFELLQAGILSGSLATDGGAGLFADYAQQSPTFQILRLGANIICQYNTDSFPRLIEFTSADGDAWVAAGIQNLPYLNIFRALCGQSPDDPNANDTTKSIRYMATEWAFGLWNPHQQNPGVTYNRPSIRLRLETVPSSAFGVGCISGWATSVGSGYFPVGTLGQGYVIKIPNSPLGPSIELSSAVGQGANGFLNPGLLTLADVSTTGNAAFTGGGPAGGTTSTASGWATLQYSGTTGAGVAIPPPGVALATYRLPDLQIDLATNPQPLPGGASANMLPFQSNLQVILEYFDGTNWIPYDFWAGVNDDVTAQQQFAFTYTLPIQGPGTPGSPPYPIQQTLSDNILTSWTPFWMTSDPRTFRFNPWEFIQYLASPMDSLWSTGSNVPLSFASAGYGGPQPSVAQGAPTFAPDSYFPATLSRNNTASKTTASNYADPDGVQRIGDSGLFSGSPSTGNPYIDPNRTPSSLSGQRTADRPIILNRPFNHVADLGYAFRDDPWRSLDFFSVYNNASTSADSGLLDLFSVREEPALLAGRIDLNSPNVAVLQSLVSQTFADVEGSSLGTANAPMSSTAVTAIAQDLASFTRKNPLVNKDQLVTRFGPTLAATAFGNTDEANVKACREAFIRTLADVGQTRTWNLMIDLVAQAGRYAPSATSLDQFTVKGERRYWLHIAIDRFTGKIIDQKIEPVFE